MKELLPLPNWTRSLCTYFCVLLSFLFLHFPLFEPCVILCRSSAVVVDVAAFGHLAGCTKNKIKQKQPRATTSICCELKILFYMRWQKEESLPSFRRSRQTATAQRATEDGQQRITASCFGVSASLSLVQFKCVFSCNFKQN